MDSFSKSAEIRAFRRALIRAIIVFRLEVTPEILSEIWQISKTSILCHSLISQNWGSNRNFAISPLIFLKQQISGEQNIRISAANLGPRKIDENGHLSQIFGIFKCWAVLRGDPMDHWSMIKIACPPGKSDSKLLKESIFKVTSTIFRRLLLFPFSCNYGSFEDYRVIPLKITINGHYVTLKPV